MLLDRYNSRDHDLYLYDASPVNSTTWDSVYQSEDFSHPVGYAPRVTPPLKTSPIGYNPNCLLPAYGEDSPPFYKISVVPRRSFYDYRDSVSENSVKDRFIDSLLPGWRDNDSSDGDLYGDSNTFSSGFPQFAAIGPKTFLCSRLAIENSTQDPDLSFASTTAPPAMNGGHSTILDATFFVSTTNSLDDIQTWKFFFFDFGPQSNRLGGDAPPLSDLVFLGAANSVFESIVNVVRDETLFNSMDDFFDRENLPSDFMLVDSSENIPNNIFEAIKITKVITEQQIRDNLYYDGINFYSPILYGLDSSGKVFRVRKKYYGSSSSDISEISSEGLSYFSEVDDVFGKPICLYRGDYSSPLFVKTSEGWAFYSMGFAQSGMTDILISRLNAIVPGCALEKVSDGNIISQDTLYSNSTNDYSQSSITIPRSIGSKIGVNVSAQNTDTGENFNQIVVSNNIIREDPTSLPEVEDRIPPYLIDDRINLIVLEENIVESNYPVEDDEGTVLLPPYIPRSATKVKSTTKYLTMTPFVTKYEIDESPDNIANPSGKPYTTEIRYNLIWDYFKYRFTLGPFDAVSNRSNLGCQLREFTTIGGTTSTIRLNPLIGRLYTFISDSPTETVCEVALNDTVENLNFEVGDSMELGNIYINPTGTSNGQIVNSIEFIGQEQLKNVIPISEFIDSLSLFTDCQMYSQLNQNWGGSKLEIEYSLINEYGKTTYRKVLPAPFDELHAQRFEDELLNQIRIQPASPIGSQPPVNTLQPGTRYKVNFDYRTRTWVGWPPVYCRLKFIFDGNDDLYFYNDAGDPAQQGLVFEKQASPINASDFHQPENCIEIQTPEAGSGFEGKTLTKVIIEYSFNPLPTSQSEISIYEMISPIGFDGESEDTTGSISFAS